MLLKIYVFLIHTDSEKNSNNVFVLRTRAKDWNGAEVHMNIYEVGGNPWLKFWNLLFAFLTNL